MEDTEFKGFGKIEQLGKLYMSITQKLHGSNAQIYIYKDELGNRYIKAGSRTRWLTPEDDNYGFCKFVYDNSAVLIQELGEGRHYGEWCGKGINSGEGLDGKHLYLFNWQRWSKNPFIIPDVSVVPVLYTGKFCLREIDDIMLMLKNLGSRIVRGYMHVEGIVVEVGDQFYKKVFKPEETKWTAKKVRKPPLPQDDVLYLLQPLRLEKLISRDELYTRNYPNNIVDIVKLYVKDLEDEQQFIAQNEDDLKREKKALGRVLYQFVKEWFSENQR